MHSEKRSRENLNSFGSILSLEKCKAGSIELHPALLKANIPASNSIDHIRLFKNKDYFSSEDLFLNTLGCFISLDAFYTIEYRLYTRLSSKNLDIIEKNN